MKKLFLFLIFSSVSYCYGAFKTDALTITGSSMTINGITYIWPLNSGTSGQCLVTDGNNPLTLSWGDCSGGPTPPATGNYALLEDSTFILLEDSSKMLLEH